MISSHSRSALRVLIRPSSLRLLAAISGGAKTVAEAMAATGGATGATYLTFNALATAGLIEATGASVSDRFATARVTVAERLRAIAEEVSHESAP